MAYSGVPGHCYDIDGNLWHDPGDCRECGPDPQCCQEVTP